MAIPSTIKRLFPQPTLQLSVLIWTNVAVSVVLWLSAGAGLLSGRSTSALAEILTLPPRPDDFLDQPWSALTYMFTQTGFFHLLFNILWLYFFGMIISPGIKARHITLLYMAGGLAGAALFLAFPGVNYLTHTHLAGASAAVMAIITASACIMPTGKVNLFLFGQVKIIWIALAALALTLFGGGGASLSLQAHIGGILAGLLYGGISALRSPGFAEWRRKRRMKRNAAKVFSNIDIGDRSIEAGHKRASNRERLDELLDKIRISGYESLSKDERAELEILSRNV